MGARMATWTNWAGTVTADVTVARPASVAELAHVVGTAAAAGHRVKPIGAGHSFTAIGATDGVQLRLDRLAGIVHADRGTGLVTVLAGTTLHALSESLWQLGLSLTNLGDIDVQTVAGAISTGTHGTGARFGGLATQVRALELVLADGSVRRCSAEEDPDLFAAARIGLGALGVLATVTLQCEPAYALAAAEAPATLDDTLDGPRRVGAGQRALRVLLVPAHPPRAHQAQQPGAARHADWRHWVAHGGGSTTTSCPTPPSSG